jgi:hypothetical protein
MGFWSRLFNADNDDSTVGDVLGKIRLILEDEKFQLELMHPELKKMLESAPAYDRLPNSGGFLGWTVKDPVPVNGPIGELAYLSKLQTESGQRILFHRLGAIGTVDVFEAVTFDGAEWFLLFLDPYHSRRSRFAVDGFRFTQELSLFSGFHRYCENFPYDFGEKKAAERESGLSIAYIAAAPLAKAIKNRAFSRPLAHRAKLEVIRNRLSSMQVQ